LIDLTASDLFSFLFLSFSLKGASWHRQLVDASVVALWLLIDHQPVFDLDQCFLLFMSAF
jgi:hypothetical protein